MNFLLLACTTNSPSNAVTPYPEEWPELHTNGDGSCETISGTFENLGDSSVDNAKKPTLAETFLFVSSSEGIAEFVALHYEIGRVQITLHKSGQAERIRLRDGYLDSIACEDGWISHSVELAGYHEGSFSKGFNRVQFLALDEFLVVRHTKDMTTSRALIKKTRFKNDTYSRFKRID